MQTIDKEYSNVEKETDDFESDNNEVQNMSFDSIESELISEISIMSFEEILKPDTDLQIQNFLMTLIRI